MGLGSARLSYDWRSFIDSQPTVLFCDIFPRTGEEGEQPEENGGAARRCYL